MSEFAKRQETFEGKLNGLPGKVENLTSEVHGLKHELTSDEGAVGKLTKRVEEMIGNPVVERRERMNALMVQGFLILVTLVAIAGLYELLGITVG